MPKEAVTQAEFIRVYQACNGNPQAIAKTIGVGPRSVYNRVQSLLSKGLLDLKADEPVLPTFPDNDIPIEQIIGSMEKRFSARHAHAEAKRWFEIKLPDKPFALMMWGDPHLDSNGCNWPLLRRDIEVAKQPGVYSLNIGDTLDNWPNGSRLVALYAHSDQSVETAHRLAKWYFEEAGITWLVVLLGNHDLWPGHANLKHLICRKNLVMEEWGARFVLCAGNARFKIHAAHNFPGHSMWNTLHGQQRASHMKEEADIYVAGHTHNWAIHQEESASRRFTYWLARARGYKFLDDHAERLGHDPQSEGASILAVFDPASTSQAGRLQCFADVTRGADYLAYLRAR